MAVYDEKRLLKQFDVHYACTVTLCQNKTIEYLFTGAVVIDN